MKFSLETTSYDTKRFKSADTFNFDQDREKTRSRLLSNVFYVNFHVLLLDYFVNLCNEDFKK